MYKARTNLSPSQLTKRKTDQTAGTNSLKWQFETDGFFLIVESSLYHHSGCPLGLCFSSLSSLWGWNARCYRNKYAEQPRHSTAQVPGLCCREQRNFPKCLQTFQAMKGPFKYFWLRKKRSKFFSQPRNYLPTENSKISFISLWAIKESLENKSHMLPPAEILQIPWDQNRAPITLRDIVSFWIFKKIYPLVLLKQTNNEK